MTEGRKRSSERELLLQADKELLCLICKNIVEQAKQVDCCGGLFCGTCIDARVNEQQTCPQCQAVLKKTNIVPDPRSDKKSAALPRRCPYHKSECDFVGTRQEVEEHKVGCLWQPHHCTDQKCSRIIRTLKTNISNSNKEARQALISSALTRPIEVLKKAGGFEDAMIWTADDTRKYAVFTGNNRDRPSAQDVDIVLNDQTGYYVSLFCYRPRSAVAPAGGFPRLTLTITFVSFDPAVVGSATREIVVPSDVAPGEGCGERYWLRSESFRRYQKDGKFALGWRMTVG